MSGQSLDTEYLGLRLSHPFMIGASPLTDDLDTVRRLEDGGAAAIVLDSLFEEQITVARTGRIHQMDPHEAQFADALAGFPVPERYTFAPDEYLEHIERVKRAVSLPVIASLNGMTSESWLSFARSIEDAGADALELNMYKVVADMTASSLAIESQIRDIVGELKWAVKLPIAVKLLPFFTTFGQFARQLDNAGADGLILFNRLYEPDIDVQTASRRSHIDLSSSAELPLRLHWTAVLRSRVRCSLAITGGVATPDDGIKAILAGAHAVQLVSAVFRHGRAASRRCGRVCVSGCRRSRWRSRRRAAASTARATRTCPSAPPTFERCKAGRGPDASALRLRQSFASCFRISLAVAASVLVGASAMNRSRCVRASATAPAFTYVMPR